MFVLSLVVHPIEFFNIFKETNIPVVKMPGYEADDIIGTIAKKASEDNYDVIISKSSLLTCTFLVKITFTRKSKLQKKIFHKQ